MNIIKNVIMFLKRLFNKEEPKMLAVPTKKLNEDEKTKFMDSLKVNIIKKYKKNKVETLTCFGDGLGIQTKINF